jgi:hypothetical protein
VPPISGPADPPQSAEVYSPELFSGVSLARGVKVPAFAAAKLDGVEKGREVAIAVNGKVAATATSFLFYGEIWAGAIVPPQTLHRGNNTVAFYLVGPGGQLTPLGGT